MIFDFVPLWTLILGLAVFFYVLLDGFDLGVGILYNFAPDTAARTIVWISMVQGVGLAFLFVPLNTVALSTIPAAFRTEGTTAVLGLDRWSSDFQEVRADRMLFFRDELPEGRHTIRYLARVRAAGDAVAAPCRIEAMYDPDRSGLSASTRLQASPAAR